MSSSGEVAREELVPSAEGSGIAFAVGFFFSFRLIVVLISVRVFGTEPRTGSEAAILLDLMLLVVVCFCSLGAARGRLGAMLRVWSVRWALLLLAVGACSLAWSETVSVAASAVYWVRMAIDVTTVVVLLRAGPLTGMAHAVMKGFIWGSCCLALVAWVMPGPSDLRLGDEEFFNTNEIGNLCALSLFLVQYLMRRKDGSWRFATVLLGLTLLRSLSKSTLVAFVLAEIFLLIQDRAMSRRTKLMLTIVSMLAILVFWGLFEAYFDVYTENPNHAETLTGRTAIWAYVLSMAPDHLWIGHGFDSMWKVAPLFGGGFEARHAENEVLQQFYAYGAVGLVILGGVYGSLWRQLWKPRRGPRQIVLGSMLLFVAVRGLAEADSFDLLLPLWAIVLIGVLTGCGDETEYESEAVSPAAEADPSGALQMV